MTNANVASWMNDLVRILQVLRQLYEGLLSVLQTKLEAMQRADLHAMRELSLQEHALVRQIQEREGMRRQLMDRMGEAQELPTRTAGTMTISKLASRLPVLHREALMGEADSLRRCVGRVAQINRVVDAASREVLHHLQWVMASVGPADEKSLGYGNHGSGVPPTGSRILEVIG